MTDRSSNTIAEAKIHILYLVDKVPGVTYHQLMDGCMKSLYVEFFDFAAAYEELIAGNLMDRAGTAPGHEDALGSTDTLTLTEGGKAVLADLTNAINNKLKETLDTIADELRAEHDRSSRITASVESKNGVFEVSLGYAGDKGTVNTVITANSQEEADAVVKKWRRSCEDLTGDFIGQLLANS